MKHYRDSGVIVRTFKLGESDRIISVVTAENGKVRAVAKGVRKTKSRFGGRLELLRDRFSSTEAVANLTL
jgi:DNA repair protein RecO (recombination protein O)